MLQLREGDVEKLEGSWDASMEQVGVQVGWLVVGALGAEAGMGWVLSGGTCGWL